LAITAKYVTKSKSSDRPLDAEVKVSSAAWGVLANEVLLMAKMVS